MGCGSAKAQAGQVHHAAHRYPKGFLKGGGFKGKDSGRGGGAAAVSLPPTLKAQPTGRFASALPPTGEGRRDFARIFFANERKIFIAAAGMPSMRPLQPTTGPSSAHIGDLSEQVVAVAEGLFTDCLTNQLVRASGTAPEPETVETLRGLAVLAMTVNVGMDFALHMQLLPTFLQPFFLIIVLGQPLEARVATYGFVAAEPQHIVGDRPESKRTPFCVRLLSPNLLGDAAEADASNWLVRYSVREVRAASVMQAVEMEMGQVREATSTGRWEPLL